MLRVDILMSGDSGTERLQLGPVRSAADVSAGVCFSFLHFGDLQCVAMKKPAAHGLG